MTASERRLLGDLITSLSSIEKGSENYDIALEYFVGHTLEYLKHMDPDPVRIRREAAGCVLSSLLTLVARISDRNERKWQVFIAWFARARDGIAVNKRHAVFANGPVSSLQDY